MAQSFASAFKEARAAKGAGKTFTWNGKSYSTNLKEETMAGKKPKPRPGKMTAQSGAAQSGTAGKVKPPMASGSASGSAGASASPSKAPMPGKARQAMKDIATRTQGAANKAAAAKPKPPAPPPASSTAAQKAARAKLKSAQAGVRARATRRP